MMEVVEQQQPKPCKIHVIVCHIQQLTRRVEGVSCITEVINPPVLVQQNTVGCFAADVWCVCSNMGIVDSKHSVMCVNQWPKVMHRPVADDSAVSILRGCGEAIVNEDPK